MHQSVTEVAETSGSSVGTIVRCCKALGLRGFQDGVAQTEQVTRLIREGLKGGTVGAIVDSNWCDIGHAGT